ncbi:MAG: phenylacetate-CoA oxygenase subunit PaaC [Ottowia sp.]|nr:phenylacetate-CoA oxygenase subunit PaaC [Ottowia sp.]
MHASITLQTHPERQYLLRIGDSCLILAQRLSEWCGHGPVLEEDIALANIALDLIGQARAVLTYAGHIAAPTYSEDQLAFLRDERDYRNLTLVELPRGDFAFTTLRNLLVTTFLKHLWHRLCSSSDATLAGIATAAVKETRYHQRHAADWIICLGKGTEESHQRVNNALNALWPYTTEIFTANAIDDEVSATGFGPRWADLQQDWLAEIDTIFTASALIRPNDTSFSSDGKNGIHSEHMGYILAEMQFLQRSFPGGVW